MGSVCCCGKSKTAPSVVKHDATPKPEVINQLVKPTTKPPSPNRVATKPPPGKYDDSAMDRCTKFSVSTNNPSPLINGYQNEPLVSLEEALQPFDGKINNLSYYIKEAKTKCHYPSEHGLTRDESAAIYIYTMNWNNGCLHDHLQAAWNSNDRNKLKPWFKYFKLFQSGLNKLPDAKGEVWQGVPFDEKLKEKLNSKTTVFYTTMGSCSPSNTEIQDYLNKKGNNKQILIGFANINGKSATGYTAQSGGSEVIIWPGMKMGVSQFIVKNSDGSVTVHLVGQPNASLPITSIARKPAATPSITIKPAATPSTTIQSSATSSTTRKPAATPSMARKPAATPSITIKSAATPSTTIKSAATSSITIKPAATPSTTPKNQTPRTARDEKHLKCPNLNCNNRCPGNHDMNHCYGFASLIHECKHHCGPVFECHQCGQHRSNVRECKKCLGHFCDTCCLK